MAQANTFMRGTWGRVAHVGVGLALVAHGLTVLGKAGIVLAAIGLVPIGFGLSGQCVLERFARPQEGISQ